MPDLHSLVAPYALDALPEDEERDFEQHLALCERCQRELAGLREAAAALAYGADGPEPPPQLRERILMQARAERPNVVPIRRRRRWMIPAGATAAAAVAAAAAIAVWAVASSSGDGTKFLELTGATGRVVVTKDRDAVLTATLAPAPAGKTYEAWVIEGALARPAGLFRGGRVRLLLTRPLPDGGRVAVTIEKRGGVPRPTSAPIVVSEPA